MQAAVVVAVLISTAARQTARRATLLLPPTGVPSDPPATATRPPGEGFALSARPWPTPYRFCCQRWRDRLALRKRGRSRISAGRASLAAANRPLLRCSAASQPRRPVPRRLPWRRLCDCVCVCVCVLCVGQRGQCGRRGHAGRPLNQSSAGNVVVQSPPSAGSRRCCIPRARACRAPLEASRRAR